MTMRRTLPLVLAAALWGGCINSSQSPVSYPAVAMLAPGGATATDNGWTITMTRANVALGPFSFCAAASGSSSLCESAAAELTAINYVDALAPSTPLGTVDGFTGVIGSASYDFGIDWFDTQTAATPQAILPNGHSMHLEGSATNGAQTVTFVADVDIVPQYQGQNAVPTAAAQANVTSGATELQIALTPAAWMRQLDFDTIAKSGPEPFVISPGMPEHTAILVGVKNLSPLQFSWVPQ